MIFEYQLNYLAFTAVIKVSKNMLLPAIPHIHSETNPTPLRINVACKYLTQFLGTSFGVTTLPIS